jgi:hypothetical protein
LLFQVPPIQESSHLETLPKQITVRMKKSSNAASSSNDESSQQQTPPEPSTPRSSDFFNPFNPFKDKPNRSRKKNPKSNKKLVEKANESKGFLPRVKQRKSRQPHRSFFEK